ncbi:hypothetical protein SDC9_60624 [bioreactor metagenome]|uniref:Uncharacterized protein n=1 Tax=bioreactor metagenome TaxID=1076179 RepID=A0A644XDK1_9ZZZZ
MHGDGRVRQSVVYKVADKQPAASVHQWAIKPRQARGHGAQTVLLAGAGQRVFTGLLCQHIAAARIHGVPQKQGGVFKLFPPCRSINLVGRGKYKALAAVPSGKIKQSYRARHVG